MSYQISKEQVIKYISDTLSKENELLNIEYGECKTILNDLNRKIKEREESVKYTREQIASIDALIKDLEKTYSNGWNRNLLKIKDGDINIETKEYIKCLYNNVLPMRKAIISQKLANLENDLNVLNEERYSLVEKVNKKGFEYKSVKWIDQVIKKQ